jgi:hypothetical protein
MEEDAMNATISRRSFLAAGGALALTLRPTASWTQTSGPATVTVYKSPT